jgi:hypothetical protein
MYSLGMFVFDSDYERLPNFKHSHSMSATLEGQTLDNNTYLVTSNYTGHQDHATYLKEYVGANLRSQGSASYVNDWKSNGNVTKCPSAVHNDQADLYPANTSYNSFYKWGALRVFYVPLGMNFLWGAATPVTVRRADRCTTPTQVAMVGEPFFYGGTSGPGVNNHRNAGMNAFAMDGSGRWYSLADCRTGLDDGFNYSNRFGDPGQGTPFSPRTLGMVSIYFRVYTADGTYTNHLPSTTYQSQRDAIKRRIEGLGFAGWTGP